MNTGRNLIPLSTRLLTQRVSKIWITRCESTESSSKNAVDLSSVEEVPKFMERTPEIEAEIMRKRNKSRLTVADRKKLHEMKPYDESIEWFHDTVRYKRRILGRYGVKAMDVPVGVCWPLPEEIEDKVEMEKIAYPKSIQEEWKEIEEKNRKAEEDARVRDNYVVKKLTKVAQWRKEIESRVEKKAAAILEAKERRERMIEEVRRQFGFKIDPKDERFKQALEMKEKEDKKKKKENKKAERNAKVMAKLLEKSNIDINKMKTAENSKVDADEKTTDEKTTDEKSTDDKQ